MKHTNYHRASLALTSLVLALSAQPVLAQGEITPSPSMQPDTSVSSSGLSAVDRTFLLRASADELFELEMSRLAAEKSTAPDLQAYAKKLVEQHLAVQQELAGLAQSKGLTLPNTLSAARQREIMSLKSLSGDDFDRQYFQSVGLRAHRQNISLFSDASLRSQDPDVRAWANKMLPAQEQHLSDARALPSARRLTYTPFDSSTPQTGM